MDNQNRKCSKYEALFIFQNDEVLKKHIMECPDCREEHQKYMKISSLLKEAAPVYLKQNNNKTMLAARRLACCLFAFIGLSVFTGYHAYDNYNYQVNIEQGSYIGEMGLPIDEYGFLSL